MKYMASEFEFFNLISDEYWQLELDYIKVGNTKLNVCDDIQKESYKCKIAVDTGTSFIAGPSKYIETIKALL